jgi:EAL domain-containing protein (putative c-di-GMP-specific phosphodiesterase class I)
MQKSIVNGFDGFHLVFQPQVSVPVGSKSGQVVGYEALTRWQNVRPDTFIHIAESYGLIDDIGEWVVDEVVKQISALSGNRQLDDVRFFFNLSGMQIIRNGRFISHLERLIVSSGINTKYLGVELTETIAVSDITSVQWMVDHLTEMGIRVALDDFGIGHSGIQKLQQLRISELKVDKSFLKLNCPRSMAIMKYTLLMARDMGIEVMIEGVENLQQLDAMASLGGHFFQGYLFGKPAPLSF